MLRVNPILVYPKISITSLSVCSSLLHVLLLHMFFFNYLQCKSIRYSFFLLQIIFISCVSILWHTFLFYLLSLLQTSSAFFHIYKVQFTGKRLLIGGKQPSGLFLANISLVITEKTPFLEKNWSTYETDTACTFSILFGWFQRIFSFTTFFFILFTRSNFVCDNKSILIGLPNGHLQLVTWNAEVNLGSIALHLV